MMTASGNSARFPRQRRVRKRREFLAAQRAAVRVHTRHFVLLLARRGGKPHLARPAPDKELARLGIVASRKVGPATSRNRAKRLLREWFRRRAHGLPAGIDLILIAKSGAAVLCLSEVEAQLDLGLPKLLRRAGLAR